MNSANFFFFIVSMLISAVVGALIGTSFAEKHAFSGWTCMETATVRRSTPAHCAAYNNKLNCTVWVPETNYDEEVCVKMKREAE